MSTFDVVLHTNEGLFVQNATHLQKAFPFPDKRISATPGLWIGRLDLTLAEAIMDTCEPKMLGVVAPYRQFAHLYAYVRELDDSSDIYHWDEDQRLLRLVAMSRLINPTNVGLQYAARVRQNGDNLSIVPAQIHGIPLDVYLSPAHSRNWLSITEAEEAVQLDRDSQVLVKPLFPTRVSNALWYFDYAQRTYYADLRWTMVATALEALIHTGKRDSTRHFKVRVPALAKEVGAAAITEDEANEAYDLRSRLSHGDGFLYDLKPATIGLYEKLEETLRLTILKAFRDPAFGVIFLRDAEISKRWPA